MEEKYAKVDDIELSDEASPGANGMKAKQTECKLQTSTSTSSFQENASKTSEVGLLKQNANEEEDKAQARQNKPENEISTSGTGENVTANGFDEASFAVLQSRTLTLDNARTLPDPLTCSRVKQNGTGKDENFNYTLTCVEQPLSDSKMDIDPRVEIMSSTLTEVVMHAESSAWNIIQISSETGAHRRNPKRSQTCITRTISLNLEIPNKKVSDMSMHYCKCMLQLEKDEKQIVTLSQAIMHKYIERSLSDEIPCSSSLVIVSTPRSSLPPTLVLNDCDIACAGDLDTVKSVCLGVRELDLAQNKITELSEVQKILNTMQRLSFLNLSSNDFSQCTSFPMETITIVTMKWLVLNSTYMPWTSLEGMLHFMPNLEELYLSLNNYEAIRLSEDKMMPSVHVLHISGNPLHNFEDILKLGWKFPNLETLVMADCFISTLGDKTKLGSAFEKLQSFNMSNNAIQSWEEIDKLRYFPALSDLRLLGQPLLEGYDDRERRQLVIGRLGDIERLNGSRISEEERQDAERAFIRYYMQEEEHLRPSRYIDLVQKHGHLDPLVNVDLRPQTSVEILVRYGEKTELRSLNVRQTVQSFKSSLQEFTGLLPTQMRIYYVDKDVDKDLEQFIGAEELKYNGKMIYTYNVRDGDEFHIDRKR